MDLSAWYQLETDEVFQRLDTSEQGLTTEEAVKRLERHGPNRLAEEQAVSRLKIALHQFTSPLIYILLVAAVVTGFLREYSDMGVILAVVILNAIIGYTQEIKAEQRVRSLKRMVVPRARVIRDGQEKEVNSEELVPGDIALLASGAKVPADLRLFAAGELRIDEAMLTGESLPAEKVTSPISEENLTPGDRINCAFMGTSVVHGRGRGIVVGTSAQTVLGSIARGMRELAVTKAPLQQKIEAFARLIGFLVLGASIVLFVIGILFGETVKDMFMTAVAAAVAAIPEGLPIVVTIAMAIGVSRMASRNAIIRKLPAVETLGSTTVICTDKTGTLTKNEMTVRLVYNGQHTFEVTGTGYEPKGEILLEGMPAEPHQKDSLRDVLLVGLLCNESSLKYENDQYRVDGDPTEGALIVAAMKGGLDPVREREAIPQRAIVPFESERGYMATLHEAAGKKVIFAKGAPEKLADMCSEQEKENGYDRERAMHTAELFAREGLRVLAMACRETDADAQSVAHGDVKEMNFLGLQGMYDPPRQEAMEAIEGCKRAGIRVIMITGDHAVTAKAIAERLGISSDGQVLTGRDLEVMNDEELFRKVPEISVYARVAPEHKLRITQQLIRHGEIVAMTGDGVNDAPALKAAHIGVAMGRTGTDVAKEASEAVIVDDNFASIFHAVEEGRIVFDNIRKVVFFLIPTGVAAILSILGTIVMGLPIPYVPAQLLWINLVTNGLQDVALAFEPGEKDIIDRRPRPPKEAIMSRLLIQRTILVGLVISAGILANFMLSLEGGDTVGHARTVAMTTMVFFQFFQAWNSRSETESVFRMNPFSNPFLFYSMLAAFFAQLAVIYVPTLQWLFRTEPLSFMEWGEVAISAVTVVIAVEIDKAIRRRKKTARVGPASQP